MSPEGAEFQLRALYLAPLVLKHVYGVCYHWEAYIEAGIHIEKGAEPPVCPRCGKKPSSAWSNEACFIPEDVGAAWGAITSACYKRNLYLSITQEGPRLYCVQLFDQGTGNAVIPSLYGKHISLLLVAATVWEHLPDDERVHYLSRVNK